MSRAPLLVIDGDSIGHRAYHAMPPVPDDQGRPSGLLLGVANVLVSTYDLVRPRTVLLALDSREKSYRHELLPAYQQQRPPFPSDLTEQLDALPELAEAFGFVAAKVSPFEADDLLASGVERELQAGDSRHRQSGRRRTARETRTRRGRRPRLTRDAMWCEPVGEQHRERSERHDEHGGPDSQHGPVEREAACRIDTANWSER